MHRVVIASTLLITVGIGCSVEPAAITPAERLAWVRHTVPLPKKIDITARLTCRADQVTIEAPADAAPLVGHAVQELYESLGVSGEQTHTKQPAFTILLQQGGPEASDLSKLNNSDQACRIIPLTDRTGLKLIALTPRGLYYAAKTLQQLIRARAADNNVTLPILTVTDWPDIADRGLWGSDSPFHIRWLADRKLNYMEQVAANTLDENKRPVVTMSETRGRMLTEGPACGFQPVPALVHLERLGGRGVYKAYPDLKAKGEGVHEGAACYSNPKIVEILAGWIVGCARLPGVTEVDVWMTENLAKKPGCQCDKCRPENRDLLEARVILAAWQEAKKTAPGIGLRVLLTEETADSNQQIIDLLPPEVTFWYYHSLTTYDNRETQIIPDYLVQLARQGHRIGVVPDYSVACGNLQPFTGAHFIRYRMNEFADKNISALLGYARPRVYYADFNTEAAGEWSWNARGRSTREFALSWAVRQGLKDPEAFADWSETLGPVAWDIYGSDWPRGELRKSLDTVAVQLEKGTLPELGAVLWEVYPKPWGDIKSVQHLEQDVADAAQALRMARAMNIPRCIHESLLIQGYINSLKALYELKQIVTPEGIAAGRQADACRHFQAYVDGLRQAGKGVVEWEKAIGPRPGHPSIAHVTTEILDTLITDMTGVAARLGCKLK